MQRLLLTSPRPNGSLPNEHPIIAHDLGPESITQRVRIHLGGCCYAGRPQRREKAFYETGEVVISTPAWPCTDEAVRREVEVRKAGLCERKGEFQPHPGVGSRPIEAFSDPPPHLRQKQRRRLRVGPLREVWFLKGGGWPSKADRDRPLKMFAFLEEYGFLFLTNRIHAIVLDRLLRSGNRNERYAKISFQWNPRVPRSVVGRADAWSASRRAVRRKSRGGEIFLAANH